MPTVLVTLTGPTVTQNSPYLLSGTRNHQLPTDGWPSWVGLCGLVEYQEGIPANGHPSSKNLMLIFGNWLDCVLERIILQKKYVAIFITIPLYFSVKFKLWSKLG